MIRRTATALAASATLVLAATTPAVAHHGGHHGPSIGAPLVTVGLLAVAVAVATAGALLIRRRFVRSS